MSAVQRLLARVRKPAAPPPAAVKAPRKRRAKAVGDAARAEPAQYVTVDQLKAFEATLLGTIGVAIRESAEGAQDAFFTIGRFYQRLDGIAERSSPEDQRLLKQLLGAMRAENTKSYGVDRGRPGQPWSC